MNANAHWICHMILDVNVSAALLPVTGIVLPKHAKIVLMDQYLILILITVYHVQSVRQYKEIMFAFNALQKLSSVNNIKSVLDVLPDLLMILYLRVVKYLLILIHFAN